MSGSCWRCRWFDRDEDFEADEGFCRRFPPVLIDADEDGEVIVAWPSVGILEWCGEFEDEDAHDED